MAEQTVELAPGESKAVSFEAIPHEAKTYQVSVDGLSGSFEAVVPVLDLIALTWDAAPPFDTGTSHYCTLTVRNLALVRATFRLQSYLNDVPKWGQTITLEANQEADVVPPGPFYFTTEGTYTIRIEAYFNEHLVDEISTAVSVEAPPAPPVIDGMMLLAYVWWEGEPGWMLIPPTGNQWPANTSIITRWRPRNTGNVRATFKVTFMGRSGSITLSPGESDWIQLSNHTGSPGSYSYTMNLYVGWKLVDSWTREVTTF